MRPDGDVTGNVMGDAMTDDADFLVLLELRTHTAGLAITARPVLC